MGHLYNWHISFLILGFISTTSMAYYKINPICYFYCIPTFFDSYTFSFLFA